MRKKYHNQMEDMKGKIRVFARVRPLLKFEDQRGAKNALQIPDVLTLEHMWKDKKREYNFDAVFSPDTTQDQVRSLTLIIGRNGLLLGTHHLSWLMLSTLSV